MPRELIAPQLRLSAALRRFAEQTRCWEETHVRTGVDPATAAAALAEAGRATGNDNTGLTPEDLKWLTSKELGYLAQARRARTLVQKRAEVNARRAARLHAAAKARGQRSEAQTRVADQAAQDRAVSKVKNFCLFFKIF